MSKEPENFGEIIMKYVSTDHTSLFGAIYIEDIKKVLQYNIDLLNIELHDPKTTMPQRYECLHRKDALIDIGVGIL